MPELIGVDAASRAIDRFLASYCGDGVSMLLISGPPGCGKSTLAERGLLGHGYSFYTASTDETASRETASILRYCRACSSVASLLSGQRSPRRAVLLDDYLPDIKSIASVYDAIKRSGCSIVVVACVGRSAKAPEVRRRASLTVHIQYPPVAAVEAHLASLFGEELSREAVIRSARASGGCVQKAVQLAMGEMYGTPATEPKRGVDTTIFEDVSRAIQYVSRGSSFSDVEVAISCEPSMSALIVRESVPKSSSGTRRAFRQLSKIPQGSSFGSAFATAVFAEACLREAKALSGATLRFPACYTTSSSRACKLKKAYALG
jgi:hypothetical protein